MFASYRLKDLMPIKTVLKTDPRVLSLAEVVKCVSCLRPIVVAKANNAIVDGNKLWAALRMLHGEDHTCRCYVVDIAPDSIWLAHVLLNRHDFPTSMEAFLQPPSEELKWRLLRKIQLTVSVGGKNVSGMPADTLLRELDL